MEIRNATMDDLQAIAAVEAACFPAAEAATAEEFAGRLTHYADHFWLLFEDEKLVSFVDGFVTDTPDLTDEMYADASLHDAHGAWQMIFGVNTLPEYRKQGLAGQPVGSRVMLIVPPSLAYPDGNAEPAIPAGATLVYVVDILYAMPVG